MAMALDVDRARLELELVRRGWSQAELARIVGVSQPAISLFLRGRKVPPRLAARIAQAFGLALDDVVRPKGEAA